MFVLIPKSGGLPLTAALMAVVIQLADTPLGPAKLAACEQHRCNCVLYARCRVPSLPYGLHTTQDKRRIINSNSPRVGSVAIHSYNHVSVVTRVETIRRLNGVSTIVTINEANYVSCRITTRRGTPAELGIVGYFRP
jgi:hypothetical protein